MNGAELNRLRSGGLLLSAALVLACILSVEIQPLPAAQQHAFQSKGSQQA